MYEGIHRQRYSKTLFSARSKELHFVRSRTLTLIRNTNGLYTTNQLKPVDNACTRPLSCRFAFTNCCTLSSERSVQKHRRNAYLYASVCRYNSVHLLRPQAISNCTVAAALLTSKVKALGPQAVMIPKSRIVTFCFEDKI